MNCVRCAHKQTDKNLNKFHLLNLHFDKRLFLKVKVFWPANFKVSRFFITSFSSSSFDPRSRRMSYKKLESNVYEFVPGNALDETVIKLMIEDFAESGYVIVRNTFNQSELDKLAAGLDDWQGFKEGQFTLKDAEQRTYDQTQWLDPGTDLLGMAAGMHKTVGIAEQLLNEGELYVYSGKVIMKKPKTGGTVHWHQDFGYWYNNRALFPHFITCVIALTQSDCTNGGLKVIKGSHKCGRIEHGKVAGQTGADMDRVNMIAQVLPTVSVDLQAGDVVLFHGNMLHSSSANTSPTAKRWHLIYSYNAKTNSPDKLHYNACYGQYKLHRFENNAIEQCTDVHLKERETLDANANPNINAKA